MKIKTSQLSGPALDWAVAKVDGVKVGFFPVSDIAPNLPARVYLEDGVYGGDERDFFYTPASTNWLQCGLLVEKYHITLESSLDGTHWSAQCPDKEWPCWHQQEGHGPLEAICRAIVASELGDEVDVPDELGGVE